MNIEIINPDNLAEEFIQAEIAQVEKEKNRTVRKAEFYAMPDGENVKERFWFVPVNFQRIRRITGYLVGDLSRFNDAKRAEVRDRVKHTQEVKANELVESGRHSGAEDRCTDGGCHHRDSGGDGVC